MTAPGRGQQLGTKRKLPSQEALAALNRKIKELGYVFLKKSSCVLVSFHFISSMLHVTCRVQRTVGSSFLACKVASSST